MRSERTIEPNCSGEPVRFGGSVGPNRISNQTRPERFILLVTVRFGLVRFGAVRSGLVWSGSVRFDLVIRFAFQTEPNRTGSIERFGTMVRSKRITSTVCKYVRARQEILFNPRTRSG